MVKVGFYSRMSSGRMTQAQANMKRLAKKDSKNWTISGDWWKGFKLIKKGNK